MRQFLRCILILTASCSLQAQIKVSGLTCERLVNPLGIDAPNPALGWVITAENNNVLQTAFEIEVSETRVGKTSVVWQSGRISSAESVRARYAGAPLQSGMKYIWRVRIWAKSNDKSLASSWSAPAFWQMGLLSAEDWKAQWIEPGYTEDSVRRPSPLFRKTFRLSKPVASATLFVTAHGLYETFLNGKKIGTSYLTPGWTSYRKRLQYQVYDVSSMLRQGDNATGTALGSGWFRGYLAWENNHNVYGRGLGLLWQLQIIYADGTTENILSDNSWKSSTGGTGYSEIYNGETFDARAEKTGWLNADYADKDWSAVTIGQFDNTNLLATHNETVQAHEIFHPVRIFTSPKGERIVDFGQNMVGFVRIRANGKSGDSITISHAEVLDKAGNFYTDNLRAAKQQNVYVLRGGREESFEPHFTFQGFRYVKIAGYPGNISSSDIEGVTLYSDILPTGHFSSSDSLLNKLQHNIQWGQRGNFLDVPTDCPQRDERLGWTGDAQAFSRTATFNFGVNEFFDKWLKDLAADQYSSGAVPHVIPNVLGEGAGGSAGWSDAATIIPWNLFLAYGDTTVLRDQFESMKKWVGYMQSQSKDDLWNTGAHFGDWLSYRPEDDNGGRAAVTDQYLIAQCFYAHSIQLVINAATILQRTEDIKKYGGLLKAVKGAFLREYVTPGGRLISSTQTAYVLALNFDLLPEALREQAVNRLVENIHDYDDHLTTGFLGTPYLCPVLTRFGQSAMAYTLLLQKTYPSWLYPVTMGATTIWERWDGQKPDSSFQTPSMNSFNHYAYGAIGDWLYRSAAGLDTYEDGVGYKHSIIRPHPDARLHVAEADYQTNYGMLSSHWTVDSNSLILEVKVPCNTTAKIFIPAAANATIMEGKTKLNTAGGQWDDGYFIREVGSGKYRFLVKK